MTAELVLEAIQRGVVFVGPSSGQLIFVEIIYLRHPFADRINMDHARLDASRHQSEGIRRLLRRCLQKDRNRRLKEAGDVRLELEEARKAARVAKTMQAHS